MVIDLGAGECNLFAHQAGERAVGRVGGALPRGVGEHGERRLHGMGEIAGVRARPRHHFRVAREHGVELRHQGLDLGRETAIDGGAAAFAHRRQAIAQTRQRTQPDAHLHQRRHRQAGGEQGEREREDAVETRHRFDDQRRIRGHDHAQCHFGLLGGAQHLLDHA